MRFRITGQISARAAADSFESQRELYDLARDGAELSPLPAAPGSPLDGLLDELGASLARKRIFDAGDRRTLDAAAMQELQAIGYGGER